MKAWGGRRSKAWSAAVLRAAGGKGAALCALRLEGCTLIAVEADHIKPRKTHPHLSYDVRNGQPACRHCNALKGAREIRRPVAVDAREWFA